MEKKEQTLTIMAGDPHFGVKQNSTTWLEAQLKVFYEQIIPMAKKNDFCRLRFIIVGDVFDSRSTLNTYVLQNVRTLFADLDEVFDEIYVIGGNHDYYSPVDSDRNVCSLEFLGEFKHVRIITKDALQVEGDLFVPWFTFEDVGQLRKYVNDSVKNIFCHTDWENLEKETLALCRMKNIITGHIHTPHFESGIYNLGSLYALTFADANSERGFYTYEDDDLSTIRFHVNKSTIRFWRFHSEEFLENIEKVRKNDYVEVYLRGCDADDEHYKDGIDRINEFCRLTVYIVSDGVDIDEDGGDPIQSIEDYCDGKIPEHLREVYDAVKERMRG